MELVKSMERSQLFQGPAIGLGTWRMGEDKRSSAAEVAAILYALELGVRLIDTAEMYARGEAERRVGEAVRVWGHRRRAELTLVSKVLPQNANRRGTIAACEASLKRLGADYLDIYLLHWEGPHDFEQTLEGFSTLRDRGLIRYWGVSNFDVKPLSRWLDAERRMGLAKLSKPVCSTNQVYYSLGSRGPEFDLLPVMRNIHMPLMAYTPLGSGRLAGDPRLSVIAAKYGITAAQLALAWVIRSGQVVAIPKSSTAERIRENLGACEVLLTDALLREIDALFPPPPRKAALAVI